MRVYPLHDWNIGYREAAALQIRLSGSVRLQPVPLSRIRRVAGADIAVSPQHHRLVAAVVVLAFPSLEIIETQAIEAPLRFPYIPGLLSFREIPGLVACLELLRTSFDVLICDGQGIAHPRGLGLASHLGLVIRKPTIGCAKSRYVGNFEEPGTRRGDFTPLVLGRKRIGSVLRTRDGVKPLFVSPGHFVDQASARRIVLACSSRYRLPEPTRLADHLAGIEKRRRELRWGTVRDSHSSDAGGR